jgi:hypothetical protein
MKLLKFSLLLLLGSSLVSSVVAGGNPLVTNIFTADPSGRVFNGRLYVYASHDEADATYWDMVDWRLLSTADLVNWKDHGSIFGVTNFAWASHWAWAPDCVKANGKYYLFLPVDRTKIGVAVGDKPEGPFKDAIGKPLIDNATLPDAGPEPIDPAVLQDDDGQTYLYFGCRQPMVVKLRPSLTELAGNLQTVSFLDAQGRPVPLAAPGKDPILPEGYGEAPFVFKRAGKYYFVYSDGWAPSATQVYAIGDHPMGPFTYAGKVMEHAASITQHGSVVQFKGKWYVLYHTSELSNGNSFRRSVCIDELTFDANSRINTVTPTKQGPAPVLETTGERDAAPAAAAELVVPAVLPGKGLAEHDFFYAGEGKTERMYIVRDGKVAWSYVHPGKGEISDAVLQPNGNILFAHQFGVTEINADKQVVWNFDAPPNTEIHTAQPYGTNSVWFVQNGDPAKFVMVNKTTGATEREFVLPVKNPKGTHGHFRHARITDAGTLLVAHMDLGKAAEYDLNGKELWSLDVPGIWSATPLKNGNILVVSNHRLVREVNRAGETVWEWTSADAPDYKLSSLQLATRLPNGNTIINNWFNQWNGKLDPATAPVQAIEVTPDKKVVWALRSWTPPADLGPATTLQILSQP